VLLEAHDEWQATNRRYLSETSMAGLTAPDTTPTNPAQPALDAPTPTTPQ